MRWNPYAAKLRRIAKQRPAAVVPDGAALLALMEEGLEGSNGVAGARLSPRPPTPDSLGGCAPAACGCEGVGRWSPASLFGAAAVGRSGATSEASRSGLSRWSWGGGARWSCGGVAWCAARASRWTGAVDGGTRVDVGIASAALARLARDEVLTGRAAGAAAGDGGATGPGLGEG